MLRGFSFLRVVSAVCIGAFLTSSSLFGQVIRPGFSKFPADEAAQAAQAVQPPGQDRVSVLVHLAPGVDRGPVRQFAATQGGFVQYEYDILPNVINIRNLPAPALNGLLQTQGVVRWEEDKQVQAHMNDSTPLIRALQSQITGAGLSADGTGVRVCVIDSGIDSDSAMYATRIDAAAGRDFVNNDNNPEDDNGHGSHVAGTALGGDTLSVNFGCVGSEPFQGVAPRATLIGLKALDSGGSGSFSNIIAAINYGANQTASGGRCDVINMSLGGGAFSGTCDGDSAAAAANNAVDAGVVVVASSGNEANSNAMGTPACGSKVIAVGATYDDNYPNCEFPSQSTFEFCVCVNIFCCGTCVDNSPSVDQITCMSNRSTQLDVTAPGCITFSADSTASPNGLVGFCGTSMASPHVAGLAALLLDADPSLTPAQVRQLIRDGAIDLGATGFDTVYGWGRIDAINSLSLVTPEVCGNANCGPGEDSCNCPSDCGAPPGTESNCNDSIDNDCDGNADCADTDCSGDPACICDDDGTCELGEDCNNCSNDCISGTSGGGAVCGNGLCEAGDGEDCVSCAADCRGAQNGPPSGRFCCGDGDGQNPLPCSNSTCTTGGWSCTDVPSGGGVAFCCGDAICEGNEDATNCAIDCATGCSVPADCSDGVGCTDDDCVGGICVNSANNANCPNDGLFCNGTEFCSAVNDCSSTGNPCSGSQTCNEATDTCDQPSCGGNKAPCSVNADCCSLNCKSGQCKGN